MSYYASLAKIASAEAKLGGPIANEDSLLLKQAVVLAGNIASGGGGSTAWGSITGTLSAQTDLQSALDAKQPLAAPLTTLATGFGGIFQTPGIVRWTGTDYAILNSTIPATIGGTGVANGLLATLTLPNAATTITDGGTLGLGGFNLTVPATGTAALLGTANAFTANQTITGVAGTSALTLVGATQTSSFPVLDATQTWNNVATTFTGIRLNVTSTASAAASLLMSLQVASASKFSIDKAGNLLAAGTIGKDASNMFDFSGNLNILVDGGYRMVMTNGGRIGIPATSFFAFTDGASIFNTIDTFIGRKATGAVQFGVDAAGVVNQMLTAASRITSDGVGANLTIAGGNGRGGAGGTLTLSTYDTAGAATIGTLRSRMTFDTAGAVAFPVVTAVTTETVISDTTWPVTINGVAYKICLKA